MLVKYGAKGTDYNCPFDCIDREKGDSPYVTCASGRICPSPRWMTGSRRETPLSRGSSHLLISAQLHYSLSRWHTWLHNRSPATRQVPGQRGGKTAGVVRDGGVTRASPRNYTDLDAACPLTGHSWNAVPTCACEMLTNSVRTLPSPPHANSTPYGS